jgi:beta-mannosidase
MQYKLKTLYAPVLLSFDQKDYGVFVTSDLTRDLKGELRIKVADFKGNVLFEKTMETRVASNGNEKLQVEGLADCLTEADKTAIYVKLELVENKSLLAERYCYLVYPKDLKLPETEPTLKVSEDKGQICLEVTADAFAKDVQVYCTNGMGNFSENYFDLEAGQTKRIIFTPTEKQEKLDFSVRSL